MTSGGTPFVGRRGEIQAVRQVLGRLSRGRGGALVVIGEAGVGKTRLLAEAARLAARHGFLCVQTAALPSAAQLPRDVISELLAGLHAAGRVRSARLPPGAAAFRTLTGRLAQAAAAGPVCLAADDLHWSDAATIDLLDYAAARLADVPVGWLLAGRPGGTAGRIGHDLVTRGLARGIELQPFSAAETEELLNAHGRGAGLSMVLHQRTGGNPLLLTEVLRAGLGSGHPSGTADVARLVPRSVSDWLAGRLAVLPGTDGDVLSWVALLPEPVQAEWLAALCPQLPGPHLQASIARLTSERICDDGADGIRVRHALIRDAAVRRLAPGERRRRCAAAARVITGEPERVRAPLLEAAGQDREASAAYLRLAGEALARGGGRDADRLYQHATDLAGQTGDTATRLDAAAGRVLALLQAGRKDEAMRLAGPLLSESGSGLEGPGRLAFLTRYALALYDHASDLDAAIGVIGQADGLITRAVGRPLAEALLARAFVATMAGRPSQAMPDAEHAVAVARELGDPAVEARALNRLGLAAGQAVTASQGIAILRQALALAQAARLSDEAALACLNLGYLSEFCGDVEAQRDWALRGLGVSGLSVNLEAILRSNAGGALMHLGDLDAALAYEVSARAAAAVIGPLAEHRVALVQAQVLALRGDITQARRALAGIRHVPGSLDYYRLFEAAALVDEEAGNLAAALNGYRAVANAPDHPSSAWCLAGIVRAAASLGQRPLAGEAAGKLERLTQRWPVAAWMSVASRGWLALADGDQATAVTLLGQAAAATPEAFERARLTLAAGLASGDRQRIQTAHDTFAGIGAWQAARRARAAARRAGLRIGPPAARSELLTRRELEVALLVAAAKTNAEIAAELVVSARTVEHHVEHILAKLGYRSRVDIAAQVAAGQLPGLGADGTGPALSHIAPAPVA